MDPDQGLGNHVILVGPGIADPCHLIEIGSRVVDLCIISFGPWSRVAELCHFVAIGSRDADSRQFYLDPIRGCGSLLF